eukprot:1621876-Rhodomonas_salina.1
MQLDNPPVPRHLLGENDLLLYWCVQLRQGFELAVTDHIDHDLDALPHVIRGSEFGKDSPQGSPEILD